jgi:uncharacterized phage-associated protein
MTPLKLQKMLYYAQGCYGAMYGTRLFDDEIEHWAHGPVVRSIYNKYASCGSNGIDEHQDIDIDASDNGFLDMVYKTFGQYSAWRLRDMTHEEKPWLDTKMNEIMPFESIVDYFNRVYVEQ